MKVALLANTRNKYTNAVWKAISLVDEVELNPPLDVLGEFDYGVSWFYNLILKQEHIDAVRYGIVNNHIGRLPAGRGAAPNVWAIAYGEPAGVTMHWIDAGVDTGKILFQAKTTLLATDTGETLYNRLVDDMFALFCEKWPIIRNARLARGNSGKLQVGDYKTYKMRDLQEMDDLEGWFGIDMANNFVDILRARTFTGHESAYVRDESGKKVFVRVTLENE